MSSENSIQQFVMSVQAAFDALEGVTQDPAALQSLASQPVTLRDTPRYNVPVQIISRAEISDLRRQLASAISVEKWEQGFVFAIQLMSFIGSFA